MQISNFVGCVLFDEYVGKGCGLYVVTLLSWMSISNIYVIRLVVKNEHLIRHV